MNLKESLETINDSRIDRCKKHSLVDILMIVFFGLLCGYKIKEGDVVAFDGKRNETQGNSYGQCMGFKTGSVFRAD